MSIRVTRRLWGAADWLVPTAILLLLLLSTARVATESEWLHAQLLARHDVGAKLGLSAEELRRIDSEVLEYLGGNAPSLNVEADLGSGQVQLFNDREERHMADVRGLFRIAWQAQSGAALFLFMIFLTATARFRRRALSVVARWARHGSLLTTMVVLFVGLVGTLAFDPLFHAFHILGFRNELWMLNPQTDYLIRMYPQGFWRDVTLLIGLATLVQAVLLFALVHSAERLSRRLAAPPCTRTYGRGDYRGAYGDRRESKNSFSGRH